MANFGGQEMGQMKNTALVDWMDKQGFVKGRSWATQRLPRNSILAIRACAEGENMGPADFLDMVIRESRWGGEYTHALSDFSHCNCVGQQELRL